MLSCVPQVDLNSHLISATDCVTFLGIKLDSNLKFTHHIAFIKPKTPFGIRTLIKARTYFRLQALLSLCFAFIHSHITYGITSWWNTYNVHLSSIQHIQNTAIRIITNSSFQSNAFTLLQDSPILPISALFKYLNIVQVFSSLNYIIIVYLMYSLMVGCLLILTALGLHTI